MKAGAVAAIVARPPKDAPPDAPLITVGDTFIALEDLGCAARARAKAKIIAVTGSVGKTGTKEMLRLILSAVGETYANEGSFNNHWGAPLSLARMPADAQYGVFELGMNHAGELGPLSRMVKPHVALITNIEAVHLEFFKSLDAIADAKAEIFLGMSTTAPPCSTATIRFSRASTMPPARQGLHRIVGFGRDGHLRSLVSWVTNANTRPRAASYECRNSWPPDAACTSYRHARRTSGAQFARRFQAGGRGAMAGADMVRLFRRASPIIIRPRAAASLKPFICPNGDDQINSHRRKLQRQFPVAVHAAIKVCSAA